VSFAGATNDHIITTKRPQHHLCLYDKHTVPFATQPKHNKPSFLIAKAARQQQAQHGRQILVLAHHLLAQVCIDYQYYYQANYANPSPVVNWCKSVWILESN
jgi:hypothetical protein